MQTCRLLLFATLATLLASGCVSSERSAGLLNTSDAFGTSSPGGADGTTLPGTDNGEGRPGLEGDGASSTGTPNEGDGGTTTPGDPASCKGRCGALDLQAPCQCVESCERFNVCCEDYTTECTEEATDPVETCLEKECAADLGACAADASCLEALTCMEPCEDDLCHFLCYQGATEAARGLLDKLLDCGSTKGCFEEPTQPGPECGDGVCQPNESHQSCPEDCPESVTPPPPPETTDEMVQCIMDACPSEYLSCSQDSGCQAVLDCIAACDTDDTGCIQGCATSGGFSMAVIQLGMCASRAGCVDLGIGGGPGPGPGPNPQPTCGDGNCDRNESSYSCPEDCGEPPEPTGECGDGTCDLGEAGSCDADCPTGLVGDVLECVQDKCSQDYADCMTDQKCKDTLECLGDCAADDQGCMYDCVRGAGFGGPVMGLGWCAQQQGCFSAMGGGFPGGGGGGGFPWP